MTDLSLGRHVNDPIAPPEQPAKDINPNAALGAEIIIEQLHKFYGSVKVLEDLDWGVETTYGANAAEITEAVLETFDWMLEGTPFQLTLTDGDWSYDSEGNIIRELWECTITVTNTETGDSVSESNVLIPLSFDPESAW